MSPGRLRLRGDRACEGIWKGTPDGAATAAQLRGLRQGPAADRLGRDDLHLRVHVVRPVCRAAAERLPELRRWIRAAAHPAGPGVAAGPVPAAAPGLDRTSAHVL